MPTLRSDLPPLPHRFAKLPIDARGYPVPWFVHFDAEGKPDFRVVRRKGVFDAYTKNICWLCGEPLGKFRVTLIGPMCAITRTTSEPEGHLDCEDFAARACPFMTRPLAKRNERDLPPERVDAAGFAIDRNPGVACVWISRERSKPFRADAGEPGQLFRVGEPWEVRWYREGRTATRAEVLASIESGLPLLRDSAIKQGADAVRDLAATIAEAMPLLPVA